MSSRQERGKRLFQTPKREISVIQPLVQRDVLQRRVAVGSGQVRTISPRMLKIIVLAVVILLVLWLTAPKPPALPGGKAQDMSTQTLKPIDLNTVKTTIPPVNTSAESVLGDSFKEKLKIK